MDDNQNRRVLIIDDNQAIHDDFRKILCGHNPGADDLTKAEAFLFGGATGGLAVASFEVDSAFQGQAGLACVQHALDASRPYAMAFVDVRMPPGWDGIETTERLWKVDPDLQIVICTAYSDYSWSEVVTRVGQSDRLVVLKKPFDNIEVSQLALALTKKWRLTRQARHKVDELEELVRERTVELTGTNESLRTEIIEHKRTDQELRASERRYRELVNNQGEGVVFSDAEMRFTFANPAAETIFGVWPGQLIGKKLEEFLAEKDKADIRKQRELRQSGQKSTYEIEIITPQGDRRQLLITGTPQMDSAGGFCGTFAIFRDNTQRKLAERALRQSQHSLKAILDNIPDPAWLKDAQGRYLIGNKSLAQIYECQLEEILGKTVFEVFPECAPALIRGDKETAISDKPVRSEQVIPDADGHSRWFDTIETPIFNEQNEVTGTAGIARDVTESKMMEASLRESEARYRSLFENMLEGYACCRMIFDQDRPQDFVYLDVNTAFEKLTGLKDVVGKKATEVIPGIQKSDPQLFEIYGRVTRTGKPEKVEIYVKSLGIWFSIAVCSYQKEHFVAIFDNITERKRIDEDLRQKTALFEALVNSSPDGTLVVNGQGQKVIQNLQFTELVRIPPEIACKNSDDEQLRFVTDSVKDPEQFLAKVRHLNSHPEATSRDEIEFKDGRILDRYSAPVQDSNGKYHGRIWKFRDITGSKLMERALRESESRYRELLDSQDDGVVITDEEQHFAFVNPALGKILSRPPEQLLGQKLQEFLDAEQKTVFCRQLELLKQGKRSSCELKVTAVTGDPRQVLINATPQMDRQGRFCGTFAVIRDITERKRSEESLLESKRFLHSTLNALSSHIAILDEHGTIIEVNTAWHRFARENGFVGNHGVGDNYLNVCNSADGICSEEASPVAVGIRDVMAGKREEFYLEYPCHSPQEERWFIVRATRFAGTGPVRVVVAHENITERMASEAQIERLRSEHAVVLSSLGEGVHWIDAEGRIKFENPAAAKMLGYEVNELIGKPAHATMHHKRTDGTDYPIGECGIYATLRDGLARRVTDEVFWRKDGSCFAVEYICTPAHKKDGRSDGSVVIFTDITERKRTEEKLHLQTSALAATANGIAITNRAGVILWVNPAFTRLTGYDPSEAIGKTPSVLKSGVQDQTFYQQMWNTISSGSGWHGELVNRRKDGSLYQEEMTITPVLDEKGEILNFVAVKQDVSQRKEVEKERQMMELQLRQAQKLESIGQLAAGIAHEINTPTQYVGDNTRFLKDAFNNIVSLLRSHGELLTAAQQNSITPELLERAEETLMASDVEYLFQQIPQAIQETLEGVERVTKIVRAMKEFSHPGGKEKTAADLNKAIESTTTVAHNEWKYVANLKLDLDPNLPLVPCFIGEFNQVILNLVVNAAHAISDVVKQHPDTKGTITLQTQPDGDSVVVRVSDTGTGIPEVHRRRIFEPFFTTKDVGKGSGQGLTIVYSTIVKKHGGTVTFETEMGKGTTFIIRLPVHPQNLVPEGPAAAPAEMVSHA